MLCALQRLWNHERREAADAIRRMEFEDAVRRYCEDHPSELETNVRALITQVRLGGDEASGSWIFPAWNVSIDVKVRKHGGTP